MRRDDTWFRLVFFKSPLPVLFEKQTAIEDRIRKYNSYVESVQKEFDMVRKNFEAEGKELAQMDETENKPKGRMAEENLIQIVQKGVMG